MNLSDIDEPTDLELARIEKEMAVFDRDIAETTTPYAGPPLDDTYGRPSWNSLIFAYKPEPDMSWLLKAACRGMGPDLFFPDPRDGATSVEAKKVCAGCPVRVQCLDYAVEHLEDHGVWGGMTQKGILKVRRARKSAGGTEPIEPHKVVA